MLTCSDRVTRPVYPRSTAGCNAPRHQVPGFEGIGADLVIGNSLPQARYHREQ